MNQDLPQCQMCLNLNYCAVQASLQCLFRIISRMGFMANRSRLDSGGRAATCGAFKVTGLFLILLQWLRASLMDSPWELLLQHRVSSTGKVQQEHTSTSIFTIAHISLKDPAEEKLTLCMSALNASQSNKSIVQEHGLRKLKLSPS